MRQPVIRQSGSFSPEHVSCPSLNDGSEDIRDYILKTIHDPRSHETILDLLVLLTQVFHLTIMIPNVSRVEGMERLVDVIDIWLKSIRLVRVILCLSIPISKLSHCRTLNLELVKLLFEVFELVDVCNNTWISHCDKTELYQMVKWVIDLQLQQVLPWFNVLVSAPNV